MDKVKVFDIRNDFLILCELDFDIASCLNVGDSISPDSTGFSFIISHRYIRLVEGTYCLCINVVEYETTFEKIKRVLFGIKPYGYWDWFKNKNIAQWT